jgi:hypothetical protein
METVMSGYSGDRSLKDPWAVNIRRWCLTLNLSLAHRRRRPQRIMLCQKQEVGVG